MFQEYRANGFKKADFEYTRWAVRPPAGTPAEAVKLPEYWRNHNNLLKPGDILEVLAQDGSYDMELRVVETDRLWVKTRTLREWHAESAEASRPVLVPDVRPLGDFSPAIPAPLPNVPQSEPDIVDGLAVTFAPAHRWRVVDAQTGEIVEKGLASKADAQASRNAYLARRAA